MRGARNGIPCPESHKSYSNFKHHKKGVIGTQTHDVFFIGG